MSDNYTEPVVRPLTMAERILFFIKKNRNYVGVFVLLLAGLIIMLLILDGCGGKGLSISVPEDWVDDYYDYAESEGSASHHFFANMIRSLTQYPLIQYDINELTDSDYPSTRDFYLANDTNLEMDRITRTYTSPYEEVNHQLVIFNDLPNSLKLQDYRDIFKGNLEQMSRYGVYSYTGMNKYLEFGPDSTGFSYIFSNRAAFNQDSEILLNMFLPLRDTPPNVPYSMDVKAAGSSAKQVKLALREGAQSFNNDLLFRGSAAPLNDVRNGKSAIGFYLKYKQDKSSSQNRGKEHIVEQELDIGKVYMIWSPNIPRRELLWLYQEYLGPAASSFHSENPFISLNKNWLPEKYPYKDDEVVKALEQVDLEKKAKQTPASGKKYHIYYDHNDIGDYVNKVVSKKYGRAEFVKRQVMPSRQVLKDFPNYKEPVIYIYGVSLHSIYNLPTEVISRSFWYDEPIGGHLKEDIAQHVKNFGLKIVTSGQIDPREFSQYGDLERELTIGSRDNRKGGLFPLFTVPYTLVYNTKKVQDIGFNTTRGFLKLTDPKKSADSGRRRR